MRRSAGAFAGYLALSFLFFGLRVATHPGRSFVGVAPDPELFIWSLAWWPYAVLHGVGPVVTHWLWEPAGVNLAWATAVPGLAFALAPVTLLAGPVVSYNVAIVVLPALAAWTAFLLCREVTGAFWPSLAGGYCFGFSTYLVGQSLGHLHLDSVFVLPLIALVVLRFVRRVYSARAFVWRLGALLALQFTLGTEVLFTATLALVVAVALLRRRDLVAPVAAAYALSVVLVSPLVVYALEDFHRDTVNPVGTPPSDVLAFVLPTKLTWLGGRFAATALPTLPPLWAENGAYLGVPLLAIVAWLGWRRRTPGVRFLVAAFLLSATATLGPWLEVRGHRLLPLPWLAVRDVPLFNNVITLRLSVYVALAAAVAVALWSSLETVSRAVRVALVAAVVVTTFPNLTLDAWSTTPSRPAFFANELYRECLPRGARVLVLPPPARSDAMLWQAEAAFYYRMASGAVSPEIPAGVPHRATAVALYDNDLPRGGVRAIRALLRAQHVDAVIAADAAWARRLRPLADPQRVGGVTLFSAQEPGPCPATIAEVTPS